jgi:hypothetical protein
MNTTTEFGKLNITVPKKILVALDATVPARKKSSFITDAIEEKLAKDQQEEAWRRFMDLPPTLTNIEDPVEWVDNLRAEEEGRLERLGL